MIGAGAAVLPAPSGFAVNVDAGNAVSQVAFHFVLAAVSAA